MRETILPKISGITLLCDSAPQTRAHTRAREPTLSLVLPFFVCRVGIAYLSIFVYLCFSLSLSHTHTSILRGISAISGLHSRRRCGASWGGGELPVTSPYRHFASWRQPRGIGLPAAYLTALCFHTGFSSFRKPAAEQACQLHFSAFEALVEFHYDYLYL